MHITNWVLEQLLFSTQDLQSVHCYESDLLAPSISTCFAYITLLLEIESCNYYLKA